MTFKAQKALHKFQEADKKNPKYTGKTYAVLEKYDGWYGYYEDGVIYSRAGRAIPSVQWLAKKFHDKRPYMEGILIFEILVEGFPVFSDLNGILNRKREPALGAYLKVHDWIDRRQQTAIRPARARALPCRHGAVVRTGAGRSRGWRGTGTSPSAAGTCG